ncbi:XapX domain-containing protein [Halobacillus seohaensis]|uniref:XapX domain-containing protein n=1 Tax=Halobacillus seohaensis TaxID=447421 RepID=A0ABW2EIM6_9BACI
MKEALMAMLAGIVIGVVFKLIKLPLPAPPVLAGVLGVAGVYIGGKIIEILFLRVQ